jgi:hypothetical protein
MRKCGPVRSMAVMPGSYLHPEAGAKAAV